MNPLVGLFFYNPVEDYHGEVLAHIAGEHYLVQIFSVVSGEPTLRFVYHMDDLEVCRLYTTKEQVVTYTATLIAQAIAKGGDQRGT